MDPYSSWYISTEDRLRHDAQFQFLRPVGGFITGEQARAFFLQSKLSHLELGKIWHLADVSGDGKLDKLEFSIAMFLIKRTLEGSNIPEKLPPRLLLEPHAVLSPPRSHSPSFTPTVPPAPAPTTQVNGGMTADLVYKPRYMHRFNEIDSARRGYITGVEAKRILERSNLPQSSLIQIWNLSDRDQDGNLTADEFCIAQFLIEHVLAGHSLPTSLPPSMLRPTGANLRKASITSSEVTTGSLEDDPTLKPMTFEEKRKQNFMQGQAELDKRKRELAEQMRLEEEAHQSKLRLEQERLEKIRQEQLRMKQLEAERLVEQQRQREQQLEARRREAHETRVAKFHELQRAQAKEAERSRVEILQQQRAAFAEATQQLKSHQASLLEAATEQTERQADLKRKMELAEAEYSSHRQTFTQLRERRDTLEESRRDLMERIEAAKAEFAQLQRERDQLSNNTVSEVSANQIDEASKTLKSNIELRQAKVDEAEQKLLDMEAKITQRGHELAVKRNNLNEFTHACEKVKQELLTSRDTLLAKKTEANSKRYDIDLSSLSLTERKPSAPPPMLSGATAPEKEAIIYTAIYPFEARRDDELSFEAGSRIVVRPESSSMPEVGKGWLYGEFEGRSGLFPETFVQLYDPDKPAGFDLFSSSAVQEQAHIDPFDPFGVHKKPKATEPDASRTLFYCRALFPYESSVDGDLSFNVGDVIRVYAEMENWYNGSLTRAHKRGMLPSNYVEKLDSYNGHKNGTSAEPEPQSARAEEESAAEKEPTEPVQPSASVATATASGRPEIARVIIPYKATAVGQLSLAIGQLVQIRKRSSKGWWEGELQQRGQKRRAGWFPAEYVKVLTPSSGSASLPVNAPSANEAPKNAAKAKPVRPPPFNSSDSSSVPSPSRSISEASLVRARYPYKAVLHDELTFNSGDLIKVLSKEEPDWWRGQLQSTNAEGLFPVNYVEAVAKKENVA